MEKTVIGIVGEAGSGKGTVVKFLEEKGFSSISLSDILRDIATSVGLSHNRDTLTNLGNSLREKFGSDILARGSEKLINETKNDLVVVESIRHPHEVLYLVQDTSAFILGIVMTPEKRFELMRERGRHGDPETWEDFLKLYQKEQGEKTESGIQVRRAMGLADETILNDGTFEELYSEVNEVLLRWEISVEGRPRGKEALF